MQQQQQKQEEKQQQIIIQLRLIEWCDYSLEAGGGGAEAANHRNHQKDAPQPSANISLFILLIMLQAGIGGGEELGRSGQAGAGQENRSWAGAGAASQTV